MHWLKSDLDTTLVESTELFQENIYLKRRSRAQDPQPVRDCSYWHLNNWFCFLFHFILCQDVLHGQVTDWPLFIHRQCKVQECTLHCCFFLYRILRASFYEFFFPLLWSAYSRYFTCCTKYEKDRAYSHKPPCMQELLKKIPQREKIMNISQKSTIF